MSTNEAEYLERRAREERRRAEEASDPAAYRSHLVLAQEYEQKLLALMRASATPPRSESSPPA